MRSGKQQFLGFFATGVVSTLIMFVIYVSLNPVIDYQWSYLIANIVSVLALYFMNTYWVFGLSFSLQSFLKFPLIYLFQYLVGAFALGYLVAWGVPKTYAPIVIIIALIPITFFLNRLVLLHKRHRQSK